MIKKMVTCVIIGIIVSIYVGASYPSLKYYKTKSGVSIEVSKREFSRNYEYISLESWDPDMTEYYAEETTNYLKSILLGLIAFVMTSLYYAYPLFFNKILTHKL